MQPQTVNTYHGIQLYLKHPERDPRPWLQWQRGKVRYGVRVTTLSEALSKAWAMIDAMLELEVQGKIG